MDTLSAPWKARLREVNVMRTSLTHAWTYLTLHLDDIKPENHEGIVSIDPSAGRSVMSQDLV